MENAARWKPVARLVDCLLEQLPATQLEPQLVQKVRQVVVDFLAPRGTDLIHKTAVASTPLSAQLIAAWGQATNDPDAEILATWLQVGAPLGFSEAIHPSGIFPPVKGPEWEREASRRLERAFEGWTNHPSAEEWEDDLTALVEEASKKGFCSIYDTMEEAQTHIGMKPVLNKLGVIVKEKPGSRKARIIWDLKESGVNQLCSQGERILLPKVSDVVHDVLETYREGGRPRFLAVDIKDAFHNIPAGRDRAYTAAVIPWGGKQKVLVYDVLVFGSVSSPTLWGRFAAFLGRSLAAICKKVKLQMYVDDPILVYDEADPQHRLQLGVALLWAAIAGFPIKLEKSDAGSSVKWIGAQLLADDRIKAATITIPQEKIEELASKIREYSKKPIIGRRQLQSLAGALSFVAGVVPMMRPFLGGLWAVLATANDGALRAGKLVHTRRVAVSFEWILALLEAEKAPLVRTVRAIRKASGAILVTDASTWGLGGVLLLNGNPVEYFSCAIPYEFIRRTKAEPGLPKHMALWESLALLLAARLWLPKFPLGSVVRVKADNLSALYLLLKGKARSPDMAIVAREIALDQALGVYEFTLLQHFNTKMNRISDPLSRQSDPDPPQFPHESLGGGKTHTYRC